MAGTPDRARHCSTALAQCTNTGVVPVMPGNRLIFDQNIRQHLLSGVCVGLGTSTALEQTF